MKTYRKNILALALVGAMAFGLAGCNKSGDNKTSLTDSELSAILQPGLQISLIDDSGSGSTATTTTSAPSGGNTETTVTTVTDSNGNVFAVETDDNGNLKKGDLVTCTLLQNVLVLATGRDTAKSMTRNLGTNVQGYSTVTLEVTPREAEMLAFAEQIKGRLVLTLRNRNDTSTEKELPNVDFEKIRSEIEVLNLKRQQERLGDRLGGR